MNPDRYSVLWPDSVSFLPCSAVCLRGLSQLEEPTVFEANISTLAKGSQFQLVLTSSAVLAKTYKNDTTSGCECVQSYGTVLVVDSLPS